jgi:predicted Zn-dependent protease
MYSAYYYNGRTAAREDVTVTIAAGALVVRRQDGVTLQWPLARLRQTQGKLPGELLHLEYEEGGVSQAVVVPDPAFAAELRAAAPHSSFVTHIDSGTKQILAWSAAVIAGLVAAYFWGMPAFADYTAQRLPLSVELAMGNSMASQVASAETCDDDETHTALMTVLDRLVPPAERRGYDYRIVVVKDTTINAFAAPGGFIVVNSGLLAAAQTPEEFAGVLAHEVQHVMHRHSTRAILREMPLRLALSLLSNGSSDMVVSAMASLGSLRYQRGDEAEADRDGLKLLLARHVDPQGMVSLMQTLERKHGSEPGLVSYLSNHPRTAERVAELRVLAAQPQEPSQPLLNAETWEHVRTACSMSSGDDDYKRAVRGKK